jgi:hypothetical protein
LVAFFYCPFKFLTLIISVFLFLSLSLAVAINPNGRNYASGAEDGYVRLHFFDKSYLDMKDPVPEATEDGEDEEEKVPE